MPRHGPIVIIGSINMDLVCRAQRIPDAGETILGGEFITVPGGKGANQAVAAARLARRGAEVHMVGRVGRDLFGQQLLEKLKSNGVDTEHVRATAGVATGVAMIVVDRKGENSIVVAPGANARVSPEDVDRARTLIERASAVVMQLEIPLATVRHVIAMCQHARVFTILDPAPVPNDALPRSLLGVDLLSPNQHEARLLLGKTSSPARIRRRSISGPRHWGAELLLRGPARIALKLGARGALYLDREGNIERARPLNVRVVDTTAAGDAFTGALAVAHAEGMNPPTALRFANTAGALACTKLGAQTSLPTRKDLDGVA